MNNRKRKNNRKAGVAISLALLAALGLANVYSFGWVEQSKELRQPLVVSSVLTEPDKVEVGGLIKTGLDYKLADTAYEVTSQYGTVSFFGSEISLNYINGGSTEREFSTDPQGELVITDVCQNVRYDLSALRSILAPLAGDDSSPVNEPYYDVDYTARTLTLHPGKGGYAVDTDKIIEQLIDLIPSGGGSVQCEPESIAAPALDLGDIYKRAFTEPVDAHSVTHDDGSTAYVSEVIGVDFDLEAAKQIEPGEDGTIVIPIYTTTPEITLDDVLKDAFPDKLVSYKTNYICGQVTRSHNLALAAEKINGTILMPGQQFSFNEVVGERTPGNGFKKATVYLSEGTGEDYGISVCQVSSTLYYSCILCNMQIDERKNHQYTVTYMLSAKGGEVVYGNDATVNWGYSDYKFTNSKKNPIRIEMVAKGGELFCTIWGTDDGYTSDFIYEQTSSKPYTVKYLPGSREKQVGHTGRTINVYRVIYKDGQEVERRLEHKNNYKMMQYIYYTNDLPKGLEYGVTYSKAYVDQVLGR